MAKIIAVCKSKEKGTKKEAAKEGFLEKGFGLLGDAHADCCTHRQVSLLAIESINKMRSQSFDVGLGDFAENLTTEGLVKSKDEIKKITVDDQRGVARVVTGEGTGFAHELLFKRLITSACGRGAAFYSSADAQHLTKVESRVVISAHEVFSLVEEFTQRSEVYKATGGVHSAALSDTKSILVFSDDLGRHNAIDKVFGECILRSIPTEDHIVITSGRTPSEMILKVAKGKAPILISIAAPTDLGIRLASDLGVTLIGFVRGERMSVYTNGWRVVADGGVPMAI